MKSEISNCPTFLNKANYTTAEFRYLFLICITKQVATKQCQLYANGDQRPGTNSATMGSKIFFDAAFIF